MHSLPRSEAEEHEIDGCCRAIARLLDARNCPALPEQRRRAIAQRVVTLCDQLELRCAS